MGTFIVFSRYETSLIEEAAVVAGFAFNSSSSDLQELPLDPLGIRIPIERRGSKPPLNIFKRLDSIMISYGGMRSLAEVFYQFEDSLADHFIFCKFGSASILAPPGLPSLMSTFETIDFCNKVDEYRIMYELAGWNRFWPEAKEFHVAFPEFLNSAIEERSTIIMAQC